MEVRPQVQGFRCYAFACLIILLLEGCFDVKHLPPGRSLYTGAVLKVNPSRPKVKDQKNLQAELTALIRPKPNSSFLGLRPALYLWSISKPHKKGLNHLLHDKWGEPPVLFNVSDLGRNTSIQANRLQNGGYFLATSKADTSGKNRMVKVVYTDVTGPGYTINQVLYPDIDPKDTLANAINHTAGESLLHKGDLYNLETIKAERSRIDQVLKTEGFFYFSPDFLLAQTDSSIGGHRVNMDVVIKDATPDKANVPYRIKNSFVYPNYTLANDDALRKDTGTAYIHGFRFIDPEKTIRWGVLEKSIFLKQGDLYNRDDHNITLSRLVNLGLFKFVKANYVDADTGKNNRLLNGTYYLTPFQKYSLRTEITGSSKSNNYEGGILKFTLRDRNFNRTANLLALSAYAGFEAQVSGARAGAGSSVLYGASADLYIPRFVTPFNLETTNAFVPKTRFSLAYNYVHRGGLYSLNSGTFLYGYQWKESARKQHELYPVSVTYVRPSGIQRYFDSILRANPVLARSFEAQFFIGSTYSFIYSNQLETTLKNTYYFNANVDLSGNLIGALQGHSDTLHEHRIFATPYAQYAKIELDTRDYLKLSSGVTWANRLDLGFSYTHGNSTSLPYVKAFFSGGSNSIRAFRARSLGPGSYYPNTRLTNNVLADQPGDIKLEANSELRTNLFSVVKGALFVDAGNVWLQNKDRQKPGAEFTPGFMKDIAVGTGLGVRVDVSFFVLRLDVAFPLRIPYLPDGKRWVVDKIDFTSGTWLKDNLVYNIAIGYPF